jgi:hypothetical protein
VFDAALLVALPQFRQEELVATVVMFRILYFMIPFAISIAIMGTRELWLSVIRPWHQRRLDDRDERRETEPAPVVVHQQPLKRQSQG